MQDVSLDDGLVRVVMRGYAPVRVVCRLKPFRRRRIGRDPQLHRPIVDGVGHTVNSAVRVGGPAVRANDPQVERAEPFNISVEHVPRHNFPLPVGGRFQQPDLLRLGGHVAVSGVRNNAFGETRLAPVEKPALGILLAEARDLVPILCLSVNDRCPA